jgi:predicted amidophosphoribosyltransferase
VLSLRQCLAADHQRMSPLRASRGFSEHSAVRRLPEFDQAIAIYRYERPVDYMIHQLKFHGRLT